MRSLLHIFRGKYVTPSGIGIILLLGIIWAHNSSHTDSQGFLHKLSLMLYDMRVYILEETKSKEAKATRDSTVVIVEIDELSLAQEGRWPWSRARIGQLINELSDAGAAVIGLDVFFTEPEMNPVDVILSRENLPSLVEKNLSGMRETYDPDIALANSISNREVVLGILINRKNIPINKGYIGEPVATPPKAALSAMRSVNNSYEGIIEALVDHASWLGAAIVKPDTDGTIRKYPVVVNFDGSLYPSLGLQVAYLYVFGDTISVGWDEFENMISEVRIDKLSIKTDQDANVFIPFHGRSRSYFPYISASEVFTGDDWKEKVEGKIVLIGATALGLEDLRATPLESQFPGVEVHANFIESIVAEEYQPPPGWLSWLYAKLISDSEIQDGVENRDRANIRYELAYTRSVVQILLWCLIVFAIIFPRLSALKIVVVGLGALAIICYLDFVFFQQMYILFDLSPVFFSICCLVVFNIGYGFYVEQKGRMKTMDMMGQYVPTAHIDKLMNEDMDKLMEGESRELSVLFCDIRSFTTISESMTANELKRMLNAFFTPMTRIIFNQSGTIDKYVGDMIMAFWGAPIESEQHATDAVKAALLMLKKVEEIKPEFKKKGYPNVEIGIGINTGPMNVGDMGSQYRRAYTVLGDAVNLGSRLEGLTKDYGIALLIGENTYQQIEGIVCRTLDRVKVKGKDQAIQVYQPVCLESELTDEMRLELENHHEALEAYHAQDWKKSKEKFQALFILYQRPMYQLYISRIEQLEKQQLPEDWDGVYVKTSK